MAEIVSFRPFRDHRIWLRFHDGVQGVVRLESLLEIGAFKLLRDPAVFVRAYVDRESGGVIWPVGARLNQDVLYQEVVREGLPRAVPPGTDRAFQRFLQATLAPVKRKARGSAQHLRRRRAA